MCRWEDREEAVRRVSTRVNRGQAAQSCRSRSWPCRRAVRPSARARPPMVERIPSACGHSRSGPARSTGTTAYASPMSRRISTSTRWPSSSPACSKARPSAFRANRRRVRPRSAEPDARSDRGQLRARHRHTRQDRHRKRRDCCASMEIDIAVDLMGFTSHARTGISRCGRRRCRSITWAIRGRWAHRTSTTSSATVPDPGRRSRALRGERRVHAGHFPGQRLKRRVAEERPTRAQAGSAGAWLCVLLPQQQLQDHAGDVLDLDAAAEARSRQRAVAVRRQPVGGAQHAAGSRARGVAPDRLVFAKRLPGEEYLAQYRLADLFLDTMPFNGGATVERRAVDGGASGYLRGGGLRRRAWPAAYCTRSACRNWSRTRWRTTRRWRCSWRPTGHVWRS